MILYPHQHHHVRPAPELGLTFEHEQVLVWEAELHHHQSNLSPYLIEYIMSARVYISSCMELLTSIPSANKPLSCIDGLESVIAASKTRAVSGNTV